MEKMKKYAPTVLRYGLALVVVWFGTQQYLNTENWLGYVPQSVVDVTHLSRTALVHINGAAELLLGSLLAIGWQTRWVAALLALHLLDITLTVGYGEIAVRDFGLTVALFVIFMNGSDMLSM